MQYENKTFDEIAIGDEASITRTLEKKDIMLFAYVSGDDNPVHTSDEYAQEDSFHQVIGHGMWEGALISAVLGSKLPGPGTIYKSQSFEFHKPVLVDDRITATVKVVNKREKHNIIVCYCRCINQHGDEVLSGVAEVVALNNKIVQKPIELPELALEKLNLIDPGFYLPFM